MSVLAIEFDIGSALADVVGDRFVEIKCLAQLIEVSDFEVGAVFQRAGLRFQITEQQSQQGGLTNAVVTD